MASKAVVEMGGPYFEDLEQGQVFDAPGLTLTWGHAALHQAVTGDRLLLPLDATLSREVTGSPEVLVHPNLVCDVAIGQSTLCTQRVLGNLFYRGLVLMRPTYRGDTLRTRTEVVALKQNRRRLDRPASGLAALRIRTQNQRGEAVLDFYRCAMLPLRDPHADTGHADSFEEIPQELDMRQVREAVPRDWSYEVLHARAAATATARLEPGTRYRLDGRDTVSAAPELVRMTLNLAMTHRDPAAGAHGRRLVYGGQTISIAAAQVALALPRLATIVAWRSCEHPAPVFEGDILASEVTLMDEHPLEGVDATLVDLRAVVHADRGTGAEPVQVLDWAFLGVVA